ncbi:MAG: hypothetical protein LH473_06995 [Chitinophagales bacterium]|nr:hypothetical protein [Chitinophagales bacterium]
MNGATTYVHLGNDGSLQNASAEEIDTDSVNEENNNQDYTCDCGNENY